ncbi:MAG TPA: rhodanese-related sulfurtransferase [Candidatus Babeliales bacterium]|nr:rhodanese-related sulfurtransferase [Candidatus Babeliales bacterium]
MGKILLFYKYVTIEYPKRTLKWQQKLCADLKLTGRILLGHEGINGTVGGSDEHIAHYKNAMRKDPLFADIDFKESEGGAECFPKMRIAVRDEIVSIGIPADQLTPKQGGAHLNPDEAHALIQSNPDNLVILDARNKVEWQVGAFTNAVKPDIDNFRDLPAYIDSNLEQFKDKQVLMYCTGGVRCERASAYLNTKGVAAQVYQIEGGIQRYTDAYPDGYFRGKNYVFDGRVTVKINDDILGSCALCDTSCDDFINCRNVLCNKHMISCADCTITFKNSCSAACLELLENNQVATRPEFVKVSLEKKHNPCG